MAANNEAADLVHGNNKKKYCKPVSRILYFQRSRYHLSAIAIADYLYLPTLDHWTSRPQAILYMAFQHARFTRSYRCR